jgi:hypothetical protein
MKLHAKKLGLTLGIVWGGSVLIFTLISAWTDFGYLTLEQLSIYPWYSITVGGAFIGGLWAFVDGLIGGWIVGKVYNWLINKQ